MSRTLVDIAYVEITAPAPIGNKELETARSLDVTISDPKAPVKTMTRRRRAIGRTRGVPEFKAELEVAELAGTPEVDWVKLQLDGTEFSLAYEEADGGKRFQLLDCSVDEVSKPFNSDGESMRRISITALDHKPAKA